MLDKQMDRYAAMMERTEPGPGMLLNDDGIETVPHLKSIPNVPTPRLRAAYRTLRHETLTAEGLHEHDDTRRNLIEKCQKRQAVAWELFLRGEPTAWRHENAVDLYAGETEE